MIEIIAGDKGKGKTKYLLDYANKAVSHAKGNVVFLDKDVKHIYKLDNHIRLINVSEFLITDCDEFLGFLCGIISQDNDLEELYLDNFLTLGNIEDEEISHSLSKLEEISEKFNLKIVLSISKNEKQLPASMKDHLIVSL